MATATNAIFPDFEISTDDLDLRRLDQLEKFQYRLNKTLDQDTEVMCDDGRSYVMKNRSHRSLSSASSSSSSSPPPLLPIGSSFVSSAATVSSSSMLGSYAGNSNQQQQDTLSVIKDLEKLETRQKRMGGAATTSLDLQDACMEIEGSRDDDDDGVEIVEDDEREAIDRMAVDLSLRYSPDSKTSVSSPEDMVHSQNLELQGHAYGKCKSNALKDKTCLVCGDKALGYNFNAVSCESCKAFFRRNAFKEIRGRCTGECDVTVESRSYCKKCRLKKCFTVGMKRDLILNANQKHVRRQKIHENRLRRQGLPYEPLRAPTPPPQTLATPQKPETPELKIEPDKVTHEIATEAEDVDLSFLSEPSQKMIQEVSKAFKLSFDAPVKHSLPTNPSGVEFLNLADASVRRLVKMAKHLSSFRSLDQEDQINLLKGSVVEVLILRSTKMFNSQSGGWMVPKGDKPATVQANALQNGNEESISFFQQYQRFTMSLLSTIRHDSVILMLIIVLTVFSPDRASLKVRGEVEKRQEEFAMILKEYCEKKYPDEQYKFAKVMQKLTDIRDINETHTRMLIHMKVEELEPLIVEIFDISS